MVGTETLKFLNKSRKGKKQMFGFLEEVGLLKIKQENINSEPINTWNDKGLSRHDQIMGKGNSNVTLFLMTICSRSTVPSAFLSRNPRRNCSVCHIQPTVTSYFSLAEVITSCSVKKGIFHTNL